MKSKMKRRRENPSSGEGERLRAVARAMGLRLTAADTERLAPAWKRYVALVEALRQAVGRAEEQL